MGRARTGMRKVVINIHIASSTTLALLWALFCIALPTAALTFVFLERAQLRSPAPPMPSSGSPIAKPPDHLVYVSIPEAIDSFAAVASGAVPDLTPVALPSVVMV
jgi:hypothetical protein